MKIRPHSRTSGFTVIELLVVVVLLVILSAVVVLTASGVRAKNRNAERQLAINNLQGELEIEYARNNHYPTLVNLNDAKWRSEHAKELKGSDIQDPRWSKSIAACTTKDKAVVANTPTPNCYSYQVTAPDGSACDNDKAECAHYTLTAILEGGEKYVKSSLN